MQTPTQSTSRWEDLKAYAAVAFFFLFVILIVVSVVMKWNERTDERAAPERDAPAEVDGPRTASSIRAAYNDVFLEWEGAIVDYSYDSDGDFLQIDAGSQLAEEGARGIACGSVKPALAAHGLAGLQFAIYSPSGDVLATGGGC